MKTVRDYVNVAKQFGFISNKDKVVILIKKAHGIDLAMLKFVLVRHLEKDIADVDCGGCAFARSAKVWLMCDKHHKHATKLCNDFQQNEAAQEFDTRIRGYIAELRDIHNYDEFFAWLDTNRYSYDFFNDSDFYNDFCDCAVDESAAQKALSMVAQSELKETEHRINLNIEYIAKLQQSITDTQALLEEQQKHMQELNNFLVKPI